MVPHNEGPNLGWRGGTLGTGDVDLGDDRNRLTVIDWGGGDLLVFESSTRSILQNR
jgi:hypothetical protein